MSRCLPSGSTAGNDRPGSVQTSTRSVATAKRQGCELAIDGADAPASPQQRSLDGAEALRAPIDIRHGFPFTAGLPAGSS